MAIGTWGYPPQVLYWGFFLAQSDTWACLGGARGTLPRPKRPENNLMAQSQPVIQPEGQKNAL